MQGAYLEQLTWMEAEAALKRYPMVMLPLGARTKEHGPHLPLNTDWLMAEHLTRRVLERVPVLALPTLQYGFYPSFVEYPGSVHIGLETATGLIRDIASSFFRHGATRFYVLNTGVSTLRSLRPLGSEWPGPEPVFAFTDILEALGPTEERLRESAGGTHADEMETSLMLHIAPEVVDMEKAVWDHRPHQKGGLTRRPDGPGVYSPTGIWGDPTKATAEKGARLEAALVDHIVAQLETLIAAA